MNPMQSPNAGTGRNLCPEGRPAEEAKDPKRFTQADVCREGRYPTVYADRSELIDCPLQWQKLGLQQTASGYGRKLTSPFKIDFEGRRYRLYVTCYSNAGVTWFARRGEKIHVN